MRRWLASSASAGASFKVDRKNRDTRMICLAFQQGVIVRETRQTSLAGRLQGLG
jgi:hypothetical protein